MDLGLGLVYKEHFFKNPLTQNLFVTVSSAEKKNVQTNERMRLQFVDVSSKTFQGALRLFRLPASLNAHMLCTIPSKELEEGKGSFPLLPMFYSGG